jgi:Flp pilus assembly protein TadB
MNVVAAGIAYFVLWAASALFLALIYWLWIVLVLDPLWMWQTRRRRAEEDAQQHERALDEIDRQANEIVHRLVEHYDAALSEIRQQGRQR